jgi:hypothetical protein
MKKLKEKINKFLEKLTEENKKTFGSGKLDCCEVNKDTKNTNNTKNTTSK